MKGLDQEQHIQLLQFMSLMQTCKTEEELQELKEQYYNIPRYEFLQEYISEKKEKESFSSYKTNLIYDMDKYQRDYKFVYGENFPAYRKESVPSNKTDYTVLTLLNEISECDDIEVYQKLLNEKNKFPKVKIESLSSNFTGIYFSNRIPDNMILNSPESNFNTRKQLVEAGYSPFTLPSVEDVKENGFDWLYEEVSHFKETLNPNFIEMEKQMNQEAEFNESEYEEEFDDFMTEEHYIFIDENGNPHTFTEKEATTEEEIEIIEDAKQRDVIEKMMKGIIAKSNSIWNSQNKDWQNEVMNFNRAVMNENYKEAANAFDSIKNDKPFNEYFKLWKQVLYNRDGKSSKLEQFENYLKENKGLSEKTAENSYYAEKNKKPDYLNEIESLNNRENSSPQFMKSADNKNQELEQEDYIHSEEFISKFGDWEKANRIEKLKNAESLTKDDKIFSAGEDITKTVESLVENEDRKSIQSIEKELGKNIVGTYINRDTGLSINVSNRNVTEISNHHYLQKEHIQAIQYIPEIIDRAVFIGDVGNEDKKKHPNIQKYKYFATGLNINGNDFTCKTVVGVDKSGNCYYDQSLSSIEKGKLIDIIQEKNKLGNLSPLITQRESEPNKPETVNLVNTKDSFEPLENKSPSAYYDKRLINICQVPQMSYLEMKNGKWQPTKEAIQAVKEGNLFIEKNGQNYTMHNEKQSNPQFMKSVNNINEKHYQSVPEWKKTLNNLMEMAKNEENEKSQNHENESELSQWYETVDWEDPIESAEAWQNGTQEQIDYIRKRQNEIIDNGIESLQENGGMSEAAIKADIEKSEINEEQADESEILFDDTNGKPHYPQEIISALENFQRIESSKWNLKTEEKTAVFHLIQITEIEKNDFENSLEKLRNYMNSEEFKKEESNYAKILTPILLTSLGQDFDEKNHTFSSTKFSYKFSTDELKKEVPVEKNIVEKGEIKSVLGNDFTGKNEKLTQDFQNELIEKGIVKPEENFILINEVEAVAYGTKIKENEPFVTLTIPVDNDGKTEFVQTKYYHVSSLEEPQNIENPTKDFQNNNSSAPRPRNVQELHKFFINNPYVSGTPVPTIAMRNEQSGHSTFIEGYEFARLEDIGKPNLAFFEEDKKTGKLIRVKPDGQTVVLTKPGFREEIDKDTGEKKLVPDESKRKFIKISRDLYEQAIKNSEIIAKRNPKTKQERDKMIDDYREAANLDEREQRANTASNFWHNYQAGVMTLANNKQEAMAFAKRLVNEMIPSEREKFATMVKKYEKLRGSDGNHLSYDQRIIDFYDNMGLKITSNSIWRDHIDDKYNTLDAIKQNTEVFDKEGQHLDKTCRMKIGDTIKMSVTVDSALNNKKIKLPIQEYRLVAHSKDNNSVALISTDGKQKIIKNRDDFINEVQKIEKKQLKKQQKQDRYESISM